jgi:hypothetical protein
VLVAHNAEEVLQGLNLSDGDLLGMARRARERTLEEHTGYQRALTLLECFEAARAGGGHQPGPRKPLRTPISRKAAKEAA